MIRNRTLARCSSLSLTCPTLDWLALIVVDVQQGLDDAGHRGPRNNPLCEANIGVLLAEWRAVARLLLRFRSDSRPAARPLPTAPLSW